VIAAPIPRPRDREGGDERAGERLEPLVVADALDPEAVGHAVEAVPVERVELGRHPGSVDLPRDDATRLEVCAEALRVGTPARPRRTRTAPHVPRATRSRRRPETSRTFQTPLI
jgi:hypothetical protein